MMNNTEQIPLKFKVGLVQMCSTNQVVENMASATALIRDAAARGAEMVITPEMTTLMEWDRAALLSQIHYQEDDPSLLAFRQLAQDLKIWLVIGSMAVKYQDKMANRCFVLSPDGNIAAYYDKVHMFDVTLSSGECYRESGNYVAGKRAVVIETLWGMMGLSVCYDVRFPQLYRALAKADAMMITVPAAFTQVTGEAHWHILLRARAIENGAFIFAPAQTGCHINAKGKKRETYGHSLLVDPWGNIIDDAGTDVGVVVAEIDLALCYSVRSKIPSLNHDRKFRLD